MPVAAPPGFLGPGSAAARAGPASRNAPDGRATGARGQVSRRGRPGRGRPAGRRAPRRFREQASMFSRGDQPGRPARFPRAAAPPGAAGRAYLLESVDDSFLDFARSTGGRGGDLVQRPPRHAGGGPPFGELLGRSPAAEPGVRLRTAGAPAGLGPAADGHGGRRRRRLRRRAVPFQGLRCGHRPAARPGTPERRRPAVRDPGRAVRRRPRRAGVSRRALPGPNPAAGRRRFSAWAADEGRERRVPGVPAHYILPESRAATPTGGTGGGGRRPLAPFLPALRGGAAGGPAGGKAQAEREWRAWARTGRLPARPPPRGR